MEFEKEMWEKNTSWKIGNNTIQKLVPIGRKVAPNTSTVPYINNTCKYLSELVKCSCHGVWKWYHEVSFYSRYNVRLATVLTCFQLRQALTNLYLTWRPGIKNVCGARAHKLHVCLKLTYKWPLNHLRTALEKECFCTVVNVSLCPLSNLKLKTIVFKTFVDLLSSTHLHKREKGYMLEHQRACMGTNTHTKRTLSKKECTTKFTTRILALRTSELTFCIVDDKNINVTGGGGAR